MFANLMPQDPPFFEMFAALAISCQAAMGLGTLFGGWRIVKTMGQRNTRLKPLGGFCASASGACTLSLATWPGIPVSTMHTITGSIIGVGTVRGVNAVRWGGPAGSSRRGYSRFPIRLSLPASPGMWGNRSCRQRQLNQTWKGKSL